MLHRHGRNFQPLHRLRQEQAGIDGQRLQIPGVLEAAVEDYQWAIVRWESLQAVLEPQGNWPTAWQGYLEQVQIAHQHRATIFLF